MSYGSFNSGLVYSRYGVLLIVIVLFLYLVTSLGSLIKARSIAEYWYLISMLFVFFSSMLTLESTIMLSAFNYFLFSISLFVLLRSLFFTYGEGLLKFFSIIIIVIACISIFVGFYVIYVAPIMLPGVLIEYDVFFSKRMNSWFNNSTVLGLFISIAFCFLFYLDNKKIIYRPFYWLVFVLFVLGLVFSGGRTGAFIALLALFSMNFRISRSTLQGGIILIFCFLFVIMNFNYFFDNVYFIRRLMLSADSGIGGRSEKLEFAMQLLATYDIRSLLFGKGIGSVQLYSNYSVHSGLLRQILELGIPFTFISLIAGCFLVTISKLKTYRYAFEFQLISTLLLMLMIADTMVTSLWGVSLMSSFYCFAICAFIYFNSERASRI